MSRSQLYLQHVLDAVGKVERYAAVGYDTFMTESHWQDAVIRQLEIIGEAIKRIPPEILGRRPTFPGVASPACGMCSSTTTWAWT